MSQVTSGTVSVTNGSQAVVGTGTTWLSTVTAGDGFTINDSGVTYDVASVTDDTHLTLSANYAGTTLSGLFYTIYTEFTSPDNIPELAKGDVETSTIFTRAMRTIQDLFTSLASKTEALTNKTINLASNTLTGTTTEFNTALSDNDFATLAGAETLTNKVLTSPDINGGTSDLLTSLSVAANSVGNVSRYTMSTAASTATQYAKLATFSFTSTNNIAANQTLILTPKAASGVYAPIVVTVTALQGTLGLSTASKIQMLSNSESALSYNDLFLVTSAATNGTVIELWMQSIIVATYDIHLVEESLDSGVTVAWNDGATWTATNPTIAAAVSITSDWAGSGQLTSTSFGTGWAGTAYYEKQANGFTKVYVNCTTIGTTTDGSNVWTAPTGFRIGYVEVVDAYGNDATYASAAGRVSCETSGAFNVYGYTGSNTVFRFTALYMARG